MNIDWGESRNRIEEPKGASGLPKLGTGFERGYTRGIQDCLSYIEGLEDQKFKGRKRFSRAIISYLKLILSDSEVRDRCRQYGDQVDWQRLGIKMRPDGWVFREEQNHDRRAESQKSDNRRVVRNADQKARRVDKGGQRRVEKETSK